MLKHGEARAENDEFVQPPSGGCVLKLLVIVESMIRQSQPPSGGCVLKPPPPPPPPADELPAAFRRLCVETKKKSVVGFAPEPAAFRRLCVETNLVQNIPDVSPPAAFRRLCVETIELDLMDAYGMPAAFRRLCVETMQYKTRRYLLATSRLQAAVC